MRSFEFKICPFENLGHYFDAKFDRRDSGDNILHAKFVRRDSGDNILHEKLFHQNSGDKILQISDLWALRTDH